MPFSIQLVLESGRPLSKTLSASSLVAVTTIDDADGIVPGSISYQWEVLTLARPECQACEYEKICHGGCPKFRYARHRRFEDLDYFCASYKMIFAKAVAPLKKEVARLASSSR